MSNVIVGPWLKAQTPPQTLDDVEESVNEIRLFHVQQLVSQLSSDLFMSLEASGIDNSEDFDYTKDLALMAESIRSYILKSSGSYHPLQEVADSLFEWTEDDDLYTVDEINIKFSAKKSD